MRPVKRRRPSSAARALDHEGSPEGKQPGRPLHRAVFENGGWIVAARAVSAVASLVAVPVIIRFLGIPGYGAWISVYSVVTLLALIVQAPVGATLLWKISSAYGEGHREEAVRLVRLGVTYSLGVVLVAWPISVLACRPLVTWLQVPAELAAAATQILPMLVALSALGGINDSLVALLGGFQRSGTAAFVRACGNMVNCAALLAALLSGCGIFSLVTGCACECAAVAVGLFWLARGTCGSFSLLPLAPRRSDLGSMSGYAGLALLGSISAAFREHADKLVLAYFAGPLWVGFYSIASRMSGVLLELHRLFSMPMLTASAAMAARGDKDGIARLYSSMMAIIPSAAGAAVVITMGLCDQVLVFWFGNGMESVRPFALVMVLGTAFPIMLTSPASALSRGVGCVGLETRVIGLNALANLAATIALVWWIGPFGTVIASSATWILSSVLFVWLVQRALELPVAATLRGYRAMAAAAPATLLLMGAASLVDTPATRLDAFAQLFLLGLPALVIYVALAVLCGAVPRELLARTLRTTLRRSTRVQ